MSHHLLPLVLLLAACPPAPDAKPGDTDADTDADSDTDTDTDTDTDANAAPSAPEVAILPATPSGGTDLTGVVVTASVDPDGDPVTYRWAWTADGAARADLTTELVPASETSEGQTWSVSVTPSDGALDGDPGVATVTIGNQPPSAPSIHIAPEAPVPGDALTLVFDAAAVDPNGDALSQTITWYEDDSHNTIFDDAETVASRYVQGGETFRAVVSVTDGLGDPVTAEASVTIANTPPEISDVAISPETPHDPDDLVVTVRASDEDDNELVYSYVWYRDGVAATDVGDTDTVPAAATTVGETWDVAVTVSDGIDADTLGSDPVTIIDWEGYVYTQTFSVILESDGAGGYPNASGSWAIDLLTQGASYGENDCDLTWDVEGTESARACRGCDYGFAADYTLNAASVVTTAGAYCTGWAADGVGTFGYTVAGSEFQALNEAGGYYGLGLYVYGTGGYAYTSYGYYMLNYYGVTTIEDSAGDIHLDAYQYGILRY